MNSMISTVLAAVTFSLSFAGQSLTTFKSKSTDKVDIHSTIRAHNTTDLQTHLTKDSANMRDIRGYTPLMRALFEKKPEIARAILKYNPDINAQDNYGCTAVMHAVRQKQHALLPELVARGANLDVVSNTGDCAFFQAERSRHDEPIQTLIKLGINNFHARDCHCARVCAFRDQLKTERAPKIKEGLDGYRNKLGHRFPNDLHTIIGNYEQ